jgi:Co/Zn/Cd efflux system component
LQHEHSDKHRPHHDEAAEDKERRQAVLVKLKTASLLCFTFFLVEVIGGLIGEYSLEAQPIFACQFHTSPT